MKKQAGLGATFLKTKIKDFNHAPVSYMTQTDALEQEIMSPVEIYCRYFPYAVQLIRFTPHWKTKKKKNNCKPNEQTTPWAAESKISKRCRFCLISHTALKTQTCEELDWIQALWMIYWISCWTRHKQTKPDVSAVSLKMYRKCFIYVISPLIEVKWTSVLTQKQRFGEIFGRFDVKGKKIMKILPGNWKKKTTKLSELIWLFVYFSKQTMRELMSQKNL